MPPLQAFPPVKRLAGKPLTSRLTGNEINARSSSAGSAQPWGSGIAFLDAWYEKCGQEGRGQTTDSSQTTGLLVSRAMKKAEPLTKAASTKQASGNGSLTPIMWATIAERLRKQASVL